RKYLFAASVQLASFDALLRRTLLEAILGGLLVAALFSLIAGVLARVLTRPLTRLTEDIERMGHGEFDRPFTVGGVQELKILADAFTAMRQQVRQQVEALRASEERFRSLVENLGIGVALISPKMEILALNRQMRTWYPHINVAAKSICYQAFNDPPRAEACSYCPVRSKTARFMRPSRRHRGRAVSLISASWPRRSRMRPVRCKA
ncbi:MAG: HAMP domain-containing protein, partial [Kiritimatiellaeota bacterium]|nr:HAMP domain-containing protein [Kiritimatiellota bacterium]